MEKNNSDEEEESEQIKASKRKAGCKTNKQTKRRPPYDDDYDEENRSIRSPGASIMRQRQEELSRKIHFMPPTKTENKKSLVV